MVEVDVFWSYGIGASFAMGAWRQLRKLKADRNGEKWQMEWKEQPDLLASLKAMRKSAKETGALSKQDSSRLRKLVEDLKDKYEPGLNNEYSMKNLLFLSTLFVPSGSVLLWSNPSWETMQVGKYETIPQWLVGIFTTTNITQGILGFMVTYHYLMQGKYFKAAMQTVYAYLGFFFILANGWDNKGYQRFFSRNREAFDDWSWSNIGPWLTSDVVKILITYGVGFLPLMYWWITKWLVEGYYEEKGEEVTAEVMARDALETFAWMNVVIFGFCLGSAVMATVLIRKLGWVKGLAAMAPVLAMGGSSKVGLGPAMMKKIMHIDSIEGSSLETLPEVLPERELVTV
jgi:hypothetical protein